MPDWGLTAAQLSQRPWKLPPGVLTPGKVITDPVWSDVHLTKLEIAIIDSPAYQRLRRVRQLGTTHLVYPGATHSRFSHSLGTVRIAQTLLDQITSQREGIHAVKDLFSQWESASPGTFERDVGQAVVLARLGALLHDLCHIPMGHSIEDDLKVLVPHDGNVDRFEGLWDSVASYVRARLRREGLAETSIDEVDASLLTKGGPLYDQLVPLIVSKDRDGKPTKRLEDMEYPFVADLVGNTICADLLDYLMRDHLFTGLPASLGWRFISGFFVVPDDSGPLSRRLALNIMRDEHERSDVVSELLKALRYRYELSERALVHHAKLSADAMLGEALERWTHAIWLKKGAARIRDLPAQEDLVAGGQVYSLRKALRAERGDKAVEAVDSAVRRELETVFTGSGDDGLLERMAGLGSKGSSGESSVIQARRRLLRQSASLARQLLDRDLFRMAGRVGAQDAPADALYGKFGEASAREGLERDATRFAELGDDPRVVIWLPEPKMRLKLAEVLVRHQRSVSPFVEYERTRSGRGSEIYDAHSRLWAMYVFVHRDVPPDDELVVTTFLAGATGVRWERHGEFGSDPQDWSVRLAISRETGLPLRSEQTDALVERVRVAATRSPTVAFSDLRKTAAHMNGNA